MSDSQQLRIRLGSWVKSTGTYIIPRTTVQELPVGGSVKLTVLDPDMVSAEMDTANPGYYVIKSAGKGNYGYTSVMVQILDKDDNTVATSTLQIGIYPAGQKAVPMVISGETHTLALRADGTVWAWGSNVFGQLGVADSWVVHANTNHNGGYRSHTEATDAEGYRVQHAYTAPQQVRSGNQGGGAFLHDIVAIAAGDLTSYALAANGQVYAWGYNEHGELGNGTYNDVFRCCDIHDRYGHVREYYSVRDRGAYYPIAVSGVSDAVSITAGRDYAMAIRSNGTLAYWGNSGGHFTQHSSYPYTNGVDYVDRLNFIDDHQLHMGTDSYDGRHQANWTNFPASRYMFGGEYMRAGDGINRSIQKSYHYCSTYTEYITYLSLIHI